MQITRTDVDALNAKVAISIEQVDFTEKVDTILKDYKKNANIPGFRKGHVPMGMIKKQYETAVTAEEVNKLLQESLNNYIQEEKLELLGNPLPVMQEEIDWKADQLSFEFELFLCIKSSAAAASDNSPKPLSNFPSLFPTPLKLKRHTENPFLTKVWYA